MLKCHTHKNYHHTNSRKHQRQRGKYCNTHAVKHMEKKIFVARHTSKYSKSDKKERIFKECAGLKFRSVNLNQTIDPKFVFNTINKCTFLRALYKHVCVAIGVNMDEKVRRQPLYLSHSLLFLA